MHKAAIVFLVAISWCSFALAARTVDSHLDSSDLARLNKVFEDGVASLDLQAIYYASLNVEVKSNNKQETCKRLFKAHEDSKLNAFEKDYYLVGAHKKLACTDKIPEVLLSKVYASLKQEDLNTAQEIYYRIASNKLLGVEIDATTNAKLVRSLQDLLKKDDSLSSFGYAFSVANILGQSASFVAERIEDAIVQADEVDGKMLQFEGGLSITALIVNGALGVAKTFNKPMPLTAQQAVKFANYFLSRRSVQSAKGAHVLIESLKTLSSSAVAPICIQFIGNGQLSPENPLLNIAVVGLVGKAITPAPKNIYAKIVHKKDNTVLAEKVQLAAKSSDKTTFSVDLSSYKPTRGIYVADISVDGVYDQKLQLKVLGRVKVHSLEIGVAESDASSSLKKQTVVYPNKLKENLLADHTQKLVLKTVLADESTNKVISVHQAFVRLYNKATDQEIIYVAEQDSNKAYKFDVDVGARATDFSHKSGEYEMYLIIGDASLANSFEWHVANVGLKFTQDNQDVKKQPNRSALPEIIHQFRVPEKRPPRFVSDVFTGLCLTPLVLLFIFWSKLGVNVANFGFSITTIGFHLGLGGMLTLFGVFWWKLNMFQTLRLLIPIAIFTFLCGNRLLRRLYAQRVAKSPSNAS